MKRLQKNNKRLGSVLVLVICILVVLLVLGIGYLSLASQSRLFAIHDSSAIVARSAADAGLQRIAYLCNKEFLRIRPSGSWGGWTTPVGATGQNLGNGATYDYNTPAFLSAGHPEVGFIISSSGHYSGAQSDPCAFLQVGGGPFDLGLVGLTGITLKNNISIDWTDKIDLTPYKDSPLQVGSNGNITMGNGTSVNGDVIVGGDGASTGDIHGGAVNGQKLTQPDEFTFPVPTLPSGLSGLSSSGPLNLATNQTISATARYDSISGNGKTLTINGPVQLWVTGNISNTNIAINTANTNSSLTLYLAGNLDDKNGFDMGTSTDPTKLVIYGISNGAQTIQIAWKNNLTFYGVILAPNADLQIKNNATLYGAFIVKSFTPYQNTNNNMHLYYDPRARNLITAPGAHFVIRRWSEVSSRKY